MSDLTRHKRVLFQVATRSHTSQKREIVPSDESIEASEQIRHLGRREKSRFSADVEGVGGGGASAGSARQGHGQPAGGEAAPSGRSRRPCLHQAPLALSKLGVHNCRGGALEKGVIL